MQPFSSILMLCAAMVLHPPTTTAPPTQPTPPPISPISPTIPTIPTTSTPPAPALSPPGEQKGRGGGWGKLTLPDDLITAQRGGIPIILSAPHGGTVRIKDSKDREHGVTVRDTNTAQLALLISQRLTEKLSAKPYFVIAQFSRKDADANRAPPSPTNLTPPEAFENPAAQHHYEAYHRALRAFVDDARAKFPKGALLIDLHGQARLPDTIIRGTRNGQSVTRLIARHGKEALTGPDSLFGLIETSGYKVAPPLADADARETLFDGGYITEHYGSSHENGIDAIQMEFGAMRTQSLEKTAKDTADAIAAFYTKYVKE